MSTETIDERAQRLVRDEVLICLSSLVSELNNVGDQLDIGDELYELGSRQDYEEPVEDYLRELSRSELSELLEDAGFQVYDHETDDQLATACLEHLKTEDELEDYARDNRIDPHEIEVYEHWAVTDWFAAKLRDEGETVVEIFNMRVWGRCTTGQMIYMDGVLQRIAANLLS